MERLQQFITAFNMPPAMLPYVHLVADDQEIDLVLALADRPLTLAEVAEAMRLKPDEAAALLAGAYQRDIINRETQDGLTRFSVSNFYNNMDYWTAYQPERWRPMPQWARNAVSDWQLQEWIKLWTPQLEIITRDPDAFVHMKNRDIVLLEESFALVDATDHICLLRCACQTTLCPSARVIEGSMRVGERARLTLERGQGRSLTKEQAKAHLIWLDRQGLVHTMIKNWQQHDPNLTWMSHGNCDPGYSFPFRAGFLLGLAKQYPRAHYLAEVNWDKCTHCGACIGRCPFRAFARCGSLTSLHGGALRTVDYDPDRCFGCGLCANTCPESAITMREL